MNKPKEILKAKCVHCGGHVYSMYDKQLKQHIEAHQANCPQRLKEEKSETKGTKQKNS